MPSATTSGDPLISVIICTFNNAAGLAETLRHLEAQRPVSVGCEIIVVDNNCTDDTAAVIAAAAAKMPGVRHVVETQQGLVYARVCGVRASRGQAIAFVDDDNYLAEDWLAQAADFFLQHPACGVFGGRIEILWETPPSPEVARHAYAYARTDFGDKAYQLEGNNRWTVRGAGMFCRKAPLLAAGWLEWQLCKGRTGRGCMAGDDMEIVLRIARQGWEVWYVPQCTLRHAIATRRLNLDYLRQLHFGFGLAEPMLVGMRSYSSLSYWIAYFGTVYCYRSLRLLMRSVFGWWNPQKRFDLELTYINMHGALHGIAAVARLTPVQRHRWLYRDTGMKIEPASDPISIESSATPS